MKRPVVIIIVAVLLLCAAMIPIKDIDLTIPSTEALPTSYESRQAFDTLDKEFDIGKETPVFYLLKIMRIGIQQKDAKRLLKFNKSFYKILL